MHANPGPNTSPNGFYISEVPQLYLLHSQLGVRNACKWPQPLDTKKMQQLLAIA
jgi:hypothetical protein